MGQLCARSSSAFPHGHATVRLRGYPVNADRAHPVETAPRLSAFHAGLKSGSPKKTAWNLLYLINHPVGTPQVVGDDQPVLPREAGEEMVLPGRGGSNQHAVLVP